ncbi:transcriptional regulator [Streptomyces sp. CWNU-1]|uniref:Transcriptional regulator n=2 Tax=Streptomyces albipurpureus TaxID=2897419 RepID=A0ABT0UWD1_9ACTN|nr:transcriptional regulator [Streptomyces sp. CWNU-1]
MNESARDLPGGHAPAPEIPTRLLVHALVRDDGTVAMGELYAVAAALTMTDQQVRLCVKRLVAEGRFTQHGRGRQGTLHATADVTGSIAPEVDYVRYAYRQDRGLAPWDGTWHLFAFVVPETNRAARDALRDSLLQLGAAAVQGGLYVSANPIHQQVEAQAQHLGIQAALTTLTSSDLKIGDLSEPTRLAAALWPLNELAARYQQLATLAESHLGRLAQGVPIDETDQLTMAVELAAAFSQAMKPDPLLPPELLSQPWPGAEARRLAAECWSALLDRSPGGSRHPRLFQLYTDTVAEEER